MEKDVVIVGGGPAGVITALTAKSVYPDKSVCVIKEIGDGVISCAIPYMIHTMSEPKQNAMGSAPLESAGVEVIVGKATALSAEERKLTLASGDELSFERLVLATGSSPTLPPIPGIDKHGVFTITKSLSSMSALRRAARECNNVVILGGGFIGAEFADELAQQPDTTVQIVEMQPRLLSVAFEGDYCDEVAADLRARGVVVHTERRAVEIGGDDRVASVTLDDGQVLPAEIVIVGIGGRPNVDLARDAGLRITSGGSIWVDSYMRTSADGVLAVGDCALKRDFFTRREVPVWLASTATSEARIAGANLYQIRVLRQIQGTVSAFSTKIGARCYASAGMTAQDIEREGFRYVVGEAQAPDRHPGTLPGASMVRVRLYFAHGCGALLGGQVSGGASVGELINVISLGIQLKLNARDLDTLQIATHPLLSAAPTVHPLINATHQALAELG